MRQDEKERKVRCVYLLHQLESISVYSSVKKACVEFAESSVVEGAINTPTVKAIAKKVRESGSFSRPHDCDESEALQALSVVRLLVR